MTPKLTLYRFCSIAELDALLRNGAIHNDTDHYRDGKGGSTSRGFCLTEDPPQTSWRYLKGIVTPGVCLKFEIDRSVLTPSKGKYVGKVTRQDAHTVTVEPLYKDEWCSPVLRARWLTEVIMLEDILPGNELQAARFVQSLKPKTKTTHAKP